MEMAQQQIKNKKRVQPEQTEFLHLPKEIEGVINVAAEDCTQQELSPLKEIATKKGVAFLAFIAPYVAKRVSPIREKRAVIGLVEEFGIEVAISRILPSLKNSKTLYLLINSPGGLVTSSYQIARELRRNFDHIVVFVLHTAASGGALMVMVGNEVVMGNMARLSPIDVQVGYKGTQVSANTMELAILRLEDYFKDKMSEEAPYPWQVLTEKIDPILREDWGSKMATIRRYAAEILSKSGYNLTQQAKIISNLIFTIYEHDFVICRELAKQYGFNIIENKEYEEILEKMRPWLSKYMLEEEGKHVIRYILPDKKAGSK